MAEVTLNWSTAEVKDGTLRVDLDGQIPKGWRDSFETTVRLLGHGDWGKVRVKKRAVRVSDVVPGSEEKLRHHLESVVAQANADHREPESGGAEENGAHERAEPSDADGPDAQMAERFRSFAERGRHRS